MSYYYRRRPCRCVNPVSTFVEKVEDASIPLIFEDLLKKSLFENHFGVVNSLKSFFEKKGYLSPAQFRYLKVIEEKYDAKNLQENSEFRDLFLSSKELQENFSLCCKHYKRVGYYHTIWNKWDSNNAYVPDKQEYASICENAYSKKLIGGLRDSAKFSAGDLVEYIGKIKNPWAVTKDLFLIVEVNCETPSHAVKGCKKYKLQNLIKGTQEICEERYLKRAKKQKEKKNVTE